MTDDRDAALAAQYEALPYPERRPADEARRLILGSPSHLREIDHWVFGAARPRAMPLRVLVAGGGTGDATVMLAQQMRRAGQAGEVTHLDRSAAAVEIARARIATRGLTARFVVMSLLDLPAAPGGLGPFDYIDCVGVLHHLPDPAAGLRALLSVLAPGGGIGLMVYAPHGRTGVYMMQDALRLLAPPDRPAPQRLDLARRTLRCLPRGAWLRHNRSVTDHLAGGDAGLHDLLLNPRDRAFTVPDLLALLSEAGLRPTCWLEPLRYDPDAYLPDPRLRAAAAALSPEQRLALAEALSGTMSTHVVYVRRAAEPVAPADLLAPAAIPVAREVPGEELARRVRSDGAYPFSGEALEVAIPLPPGAAAILRLIDGRRDVAELGRLVTPRGIGFDRVWPDLATRLSAANLILAAPPGDARG
jgi:SAM-dependent methyltransferase